MSTSIVAEPTLHPTTTQMQANAKEYLRDGRFYWTNAGFPKELDRSKSKYTKSPLRSFHPLPPSGSLEREILRECRDTSINFKTIDERQLRGRKKINKKRPCYLASYDKSSNEGVIFLGTTTAPDNVQRFVIVQSRSPTDLLQFGSLGTKPPNSFGEKDKKTYFNISHPLRVQFAYLLNSSLFPRTKEDGIWYDGHEPPLVSIANFATQSSDVAIISNDGLEKSIVFDKESEQLFWTKHKEYHRQRPKQRGPDDDSGGAGPDGDSGGVGPGDDSGGAGPDDDSRKAGPGDDSGGAGLGDGCLGDGCSSSGGTEPNAGGGGSNKGGFSSCKTEDAPWGRVGDQRIGIDIPLVTEDIYSDEDEEIDLEKLVINSDTNDAPWGRIGNQRIGIDIPLVTEDIYSDPDEEMDLESDEELHEVDNDPNKPESSDQKGITIWPNPSDEGSSQSYTIPKPYFVISMPFENVFALLDYDHSIGKWRWTGKASKKYHIAISIEGLSYEYPISGRSDSIRRIFNWHTKEYIELPPYPHETYKLDSTIVGMTVDTSVQPYAFKVIECGNIGTMIYDSTTHSWIHRWLQTQFRGCRVYGNSNVASCKGVAFIIDNYDWIVIYDTKKDKWDVVMTPESWDDAMTPESWDDVMTPESWHDSGVPREIGDKLLCGIGSWDDRIFASIDWKTRYENTFEIWELVDIAKPELKKFDTIPTEMYSWLKNEEEDYRHFKIDVSYCNENLLIWTWINSSAKRFVLYNLARKTWEKLELPLLTLTDLEIDKVGYGRRHGVNVDSLTVGPYRTLDEKKAVFDSTWSNVALELSMAACGELCGCN